MLALRDSITFRQYRIISELILKLSKGDQLLFRLYHSHRNITDTLQNITVQLTIVIGKS